MMKLKSLMSKVCRRHCYATLFVAAVFNANIAQAASGYHPVIVTSEIGNPAPETSKVLIENFTEAMQVGFLKGLARQFYGTGEEFPSTAPSSPMSMWLAMQRAIDGEIESRYQAIQNQLRRPQSGRYASKIDIFWSKQDYGAPMIPMLQNGLGALMGFTQGAGLTNVEEANPFAFQLGNYALRAQLVSEDQVGGIMQMYGTVGQVYRDLLQEYPNSWHPLHASGEVSLAADGGLTFTVILLLAPPAFSQEADELDPNNNFTIQKVEFDPNWDTTEHVGLQLRFRRTYGGSNPSPPTLNVKFGMFRDSIMLLTSCSPRTCLRHRRHLPTFNVRVHGTRAENFGAWISGLQEFQFMINDIRIDLNTMTVMEEGTSTPIITSNRQVIETLHGGGGLFERIIRSTVSGRLRGGIDDELRNASQNFESALLGSLGSLTGLWEDPEEGLR